MKKYCFLILFLACATSGFSYSKLFWMGTYLLSGSNTQSGIGSYQGEVVIQPQGENFSVIWKVGTRQTQVGIGILTGDVLSVAYTDLNNPGNWGIVAFKVLSEGQLEGRWSNYNGYTQKPEILVWKGY